MSEHADLKPTTPWVWVLAAGYSALLLGAGLWVALATDNWFALLLAIGLTAPVEVLLLSRHRRRAASRRASSDGSGPRISV